MRFMKRPSATGLLSVIILFNLTAFGLASLHTRPIDVTAIIMGILASALLLFQYFIITRFFRQADRYVLIIANILSGIGFIVQYRLNPAIAMKQMQWFGVGMVVMIFALVLVKNIKHWDKYIYMYMIFGLSLLVAALVFGKTIGGSKNWFSIAGYSFQPSEFVKILLLFIKNISLKNNLTFSLYRQNNLPKRYKFPFPYPSKPALAVRPCSKFLLKKFLCPIYIQRPLAAIINRIYTHGR